MGFPELQTYAMLLVGLGLIEFMTFSGQADLEQAYC